MVGTERRPNSDKSSTTQPSPDFKVKDEARKLITEASIAVHNARQQAQADPENDGLQNQLRQAEQDLDQAYTNFGKASTNTSPVLTTPSSSDVDPTDWDKRHDQAYRLLQISLSETYKELTFDCTDLPSTWRTLQNHFESKAAADVMAAEAQLEQLRLNENDDVLDFLKSVSFEAH